MTALERSARDLGFQLVETSGDVVLVTSGAGLAMMMMDLLADHGLSAASFMDNLRGAPDETMTERLKIARALAARPNIKAIVFQTVIASRSLAERIDALDRLDHRRAAAKAAVCRARRRPRRHPQDERRAGDREIARARRRRLHRSGRTGQSGRASVAMTPDRSQAGYIARAVARAPHRTPHRIAGRLRQIPCRSPCAGPAPDRR